MRTRVYIDARAFNAALERAISRSRKEASVVADTAFKGVVKGILGVTPPLSADYKQSSTGSPTMPDFKRGMERAEKAIQKDMAKAFNVVADDDSRLKKDTRGNLQWYLSVRNKRKRITSKYHVPITQKAGLAIQKEIKRRVGWTLAGWVALANEYGIRTPGWISGKPSSRGTCKTIKQPDFYGFDAVNKTDHEDSNQIESKINFALQMQVGKMERSMKNRADAALREATR